MSSSRRRSHALRSPARISSYLRCCAPSLNSIVPRAAGRTHRSRELGGDGSLDPEGLRSPNAAELTDPADERRLEMSLHPVPDEFVPGNELQDALVKTDELAACKPLLERGGRERPRV